MSDMQGRVGVARIVPTQKRSRERFDAILGAAEALLMEKGGDGFRMSDLKQASGVPFGSLYQYFPDKTAVIGTLAERYNSAGHDCVKAALDAAQEPGDLRPALQRITREFHQMYREQPVTLAIWQATMADPLLQQLDRQDCDHLAGLLTNSLLRMGYDDPPELRRFAGLMITLIASAVRHAVTLDKAEGARVLDRFCALLPQSPLPAQGPAI